MANRKTTKKKQGGISCEPHVTRSGLIDMKLMRGFTVWIKGIPFMLRYATTITGMPANFRAAGLIKGNDHCG